MLDQLRAQIQSRVDELTAEIDSLRKALLALDSDVAAGTPKARPGRIARSASSTRTASARRSPSVRRGNRAEAQSARRTARGATRTAVLEALSSGEAMTATEVAAKAGLGRATVSTTLSKLANSGEEQKAERGYRAATGAKVAA